MKALIFTALFLTGCATTMPDPDVVKSTSRDKTMESMARAAIISEMLNSKDPIVRARGAEAAAEFLKKEK
jgi:PBP1b-binding outer membrane lipoprotein LpoB